MLISLFRIMIKRMNSMLNQCWQHGRRFSSEQSGSVMPFPVLVFAGALTVVAYSLDTTRTVDSLSQVKRATDSAAMAVGYKEIANMNQDDVDDLNVLARGYIQSNLGLDGALENQVDLNSIRVVKSQGNTGAVTYEVSVQVTTEAPELGVAATQKTVSSTVEVKTRPTEVALMLPNTVAENASDIAALRRLGNKFARQFINGDDQGNREAGVDQRRWLALIPYSQAVNVYDEKDSQRIDRWAAGNLTPAELRSLFRTGKVNSLADPRFPDRIAHLLCLYRGLGQGENFFWDSPPTGQYGVYYRHDLPQNGSPGATPISWRGPNPYLWPDSVAIDQRWIVADKGCPNAPLLPLTNDLDKIDQRLDEMSVRFNVNYAIAMGWAAASLSPRMRGQIGWGDSELPLDFSANDQNYKAIIMLANTTGDWFDTDRYNFYRDELLGQSGTEVARDFAKQRFIDLCRSFRRRNLHFYFIGVRPGDPAEFGRVLFDRIAGPGIQICTQGRDNMHFIDAEHFYPAESQIKDVLEEIAQDINRHNYVRLIK
jgi:hypothetical protein